MMIFSANKVYRKGLSISNKTDAAGGIFHDRMILAWKKIEQIVLKTDQD